MQEHIFMKKLIRILMLVICLIPASSFAAGRDIKVMVNGKPLITDTPAIAVDQRTMVPFRALFESLGVKDIIWDQPTQTVVGRNENITVKLVLGSYDMDVNGDTVTMDVAPIAVNGRTMIPLSFVSKSLGAKVSWDQNTYTVTILTDQKNYDSNETISPSADDLLFEGHTIGNDIRGYYAVEDLSRNKYVINFMDKGKAEMINIKDRSKVQGMYSYSLDKLNLNIGKFKSSYQREDEKYNGLDIVLMKDEKNPTAGLTFAMTEIDKSEYDKYAQKPDDEK